MTRSSTHDVTELLIEWSNGNKTALDKLMPLIHEELRPLAHHYMSHAWRRPRPETLCARATLCKPLRWLTRLISAGNSKDYSLAKPGPLLRHRGNLDAQHPGGSCAQSRLRQE